MRHRALRSLSALCLGALPLACCPLSMRTAAAQDATSPPLIALDPQNQHYYERVDVPGEITWDQAKAAAASEQYRGLPGHLATITSAEENAFIVEHCGGELVRRKWLGGYKTADDPADPSANWAWITGEPWAYANWACGEPNDYGGRNENALVFKWADADLGTWNDLEEDADTFSATVFGFPLSKQVMDGYIVEFELAAASSPPVHRVFCGLYYANDAKDPDRSFYRAADTWLNEAKAGDDRAGSDQFDLVAVHSLQEFRVRWSEMATVSRRPEFAAGEVAVFSHSS